MDHIEALHQAGVNNRRLNSVINEFEFIAEARITYHNTTLVNYMSLLYDRSMYNALRGHWHASPGLWAILVAIWGVIVFVYKAVVWIIDILKIKEILEIAAILRIIWPEFRVKYDKILGKISEFSKQIGFGADGLIHLINASQTGLNVLKSITGKSYEWLYIAGADKALRALAFVSSGAYEIASDPASVLNRSFFRPSEETGRLITTKWDETMAWLEDTTDKAKVALQKANDTFNSLLVMAANMPDFISNHIPDFIPDSLNWLNATIDNDILPALTNINKQFTQINAVLQAERDRAEALAAQLMLPGDLLENIDSLPDSEKAEQEIKIDDITSRFYEKQTDEITTSDSAIISELESVRLLYLAAVPIPEFSNVETSGRPGIIYTPAEKVIGWFVGDF